MGPLPVSSCWEDRPAGNNVVSNPHGFVPPSRLRTNSKRDQALVTSAALVLVLSQGLVVAKDLKVRIFLSIPWKNIPFFNI